MKTFYRSVLKLGWLSFLLSLAYSSNAQSPPGVGSRPEYSALENVSFDPCTGEITFSFIHRWFCSNGAPLWALTDGRGFEGNDNYVYIKQGVSITNILQIKKGNDVEGNKWWVDSYPISLFPLNGYTLDKFQVSDEIEESAFNGFPTGYGVRNVAKVRFTIPQSLFGSAITLGIKGKFGSYDFDKTAITPLLIPPVSAPYSFRSESGCGKVKLEWHQPDQICPGAKIELRRDNVTINNNIDINTTSYEDNIANGNYRYEIRSKLRDGIYSPWISVNGSPIRDVTMPSAVIVEQPNCATIATDIRTRVEWVADPSNYPSRFVVERSKSSDFARSFVTENVSFDRTWFVDSEDLEFNTPYYYRVKAENSKCGTSATSLAKNIYINNAPDAPAVVSTTLLPDNTIRVNWNHNGLRNEGFTIVRSPLDNNGTSRQETFNLNTITSYIDDYVPNCALYQYEIKANSKCFGPVGSTNRPQIVFVVNDITTTFGPGALKASKGYYPDKVKLQWDYSNNKAIDNFIIFRRPLGSLAAFEQIQSVAAPNNLWEDKTGTAGQLYEYGIVAQIKNCGGGPLYSNSHPNLGDDYRTVGFRSPTGLVNGKISYNGGIALEGAKVVAAKAESSRLGTSLRFNGATHVEINDLNNPKATTWMPSTNYALSLWLKPQGAATGMSILNKMGTTNPVHAMEIVGTGTRVDTNLVFNADTVRWMNKGGIFGKKTNNILFSPDSAFILGVFKNDSLKLIEKTFVDGNISNDTIYNESKTLVTGIIAKDIVYGRDTIYRPKAQNTAKPEKNREIGIIQNDTIFSPSKDSITSFIHNDTLFHATYYLEASKKGNVYGSISTVSGRVTIFPVDNPTTRRYIFGNNITSSSNGLGTILAFIIKDTLYNAHYGLGTVPKKGEKFAVREGNYIYHLVAGSDVKIKKGAAYAVRKNDTVYAFSNPLLVSNIIDNNVLFNVIYKTTTKIVKDGVKNFLENNSIFTFNRDTILAVTVNNTVYKFDWVNSGKIVGDAIKSPSNKSLYAIELDNKVFEMLHFQTINSVKSITGIFPRNMYDVRYSTFIGGQSKAVTADSVLEDEFSNITVAYNGIHLKIFLNGIIKDSISANGTLENSNLPLIIGAKSITSGFSNYYSGNIDEVLVWNTTLTSLQIKQNHGRYLVGNEPGVVGYWRLDENAGNRIYDASKNDAEPDENNRFNKHEGRIIGSANWTDQAPDPEVLGFAGFTNHKGDYTIPSIRFGGTGENFKIVPIFKTHEFDPSNTVLFLGEGSVVQNSINFLDKSSFKVTGVVKVDPLAFGIARESANAPNCYIEGAYIKIDDDFVVKNGKPVQTDSKGKFEINVPIGEHSISVFQDGHTYGLGKWPVNTVLHDFQEDITGITFYDNTIRTVIGNVVGGNEEGDKFPGFGHTVNNLGKAKIKYVSLGSECFSKTVETNANTGEYIIELPPLKYRLDSLNIATQGYSFNKELKKLADEILDLSKFFPDTAYTKKDTTFIVKGGTKNAGNIAKIEALRYHLVKKYVYHDKPKILISAVDSSEFIGDTSIAYTPLGTTVPINISLQSIPLGYPIFQTSKKYSLNIKVVELYKNTDSNTEKSYFVKNAGVGILNEIGEQNIQISLSKGDTVYSFFAGPPNVIENGKYSFTKTLQIVGPQGATWEPGNGDNILDRYFRAYVIGNRQKGELDFITRPDLEPIKMVDFILRDPPGGRSSATWKAGTEVSFYTKYSRNISLSNEINSKIGFFLGITQALTGLKSEAEGTNTIRSTYSLGLTGEYKYQHTLSNSTNISTNDRPYRPGTPSDLFIGSGVNMLYGLNDIISIVPSKQCTISGSNCGVNEAIGSNGESFRLSKKEQYAFTAQKDFNTYFVYTQEHIENEMAGLVKKRNALFQNDALYHSFLTNSSPFYGVNNDSKDLASNRLYVTTETGDNTVIESDSGYSYVYRRKLDPAIEKVDFVRLFNNQISLWRQVLAFNEKEKLEGINRIADGESHKNFSFSYGSSISNSSKSEVSNGGSFEFEIQAQNSLKVETKAELPGTKAEFKAEIGSSTSTSIETGSTTENTATIEYTLEDNDWNDQISVDVIDSKYGNGPIFVTKGGRTSCPHEPTYLSKYYGSGGEQLSAGTIPRDQPYLRVTPNILTNIASDKRATFAVELGNYNREDSIRNYVLKYDTRTNPGAADVRVDERSLLFNYPISIAAGQSVNKIITFEKGPIDYNYDNLKLLFTSECQFNFGINNEKSIYDSTSISVHFLPTCTDAEFETPNTQWILNNSFKDTLGLALGGYDINFPGLKDLRLQFKKTSQSEAEWLTWNTFWKTTHPDKPTDPSTDSIPTTKGKIDYAWVVSQLTDGDYDLRMQTTCLVKESIEPVKINSEIITGTIDRVNPHPFGAPTPADGILSPNDDISIQFNEDIEAGKLTWDNFEVKGVLNGSELRHDASIYFDGTPEKYMKVNGLLLQNQSFTIEFWAKRKAKGEEIILAQGVAGTPEMFVGFDANNKLIFSLNGKTIVSDKTIEDDKWHHLSVSYDYDENRAYLYGDGELLNYDENFVGSYNGSGHIYVGRRNFAPFMSFKGNIHELRIWKKPLPLTDVVINLGKKMSGREIGLVGNWPMDEAGGKLAQDVANKRNGEVTAEWAVEPSSKAMAFTDGSYIEAKGGKAAFTAEMDFTVEFWFKAANAGDYTLFSNGKGDLQDSSKTDWAISSNGAGKIIITNNGKVFTAVDSNFFNNKWHHFALVVNRLGNTSAFIDGQLQNSTSRLGWTGFGGAKLWLGARGWYIGNTKNFDNHFSGNLDEVRVWGLARKQDQIKNDMHNRLHGNEFGLASYYPFEAYQKDAAGIVLLEETLREQSIVRDNITKAIVPNDTANATLATYSDDTPKIKLPRPAENVNFNYSVNKDKIIISLTDEAKRVENCILDVTVRNIQDLRGNSMQSPATWTAYIDKNQVVWEDQEFTFRKKLYDTLSFTAYVSNQGGNEHDFVIDNLPLWLKATPASGKIKPNSRQKIVFTVNEGLNIGNYNESLYLRTSFGFNEVLSLDVKVFQPAPADWSVNPAKFQFSASMIGQIKVDNILSTDPEDKIAAFVGNECRGVASLSYIEIYDTYQAFLNIYSNESSSEKVDFRIWDASQGLTLINVTPFVGTVPNFNFAFEANKVLGSTSKPVIWHSLNGVLRKMPLPQGWKWISLGLKSDALFRSSLLFKDVALHDGDEFKGAVNFDRYDSTTTKWFGNMAGDNMSLRTGGLRNEESYKVKLRKADTLNFRGSIVDATSKPITLQAGWNWVGFIPQYNMDINEALATLNPTEGDVIKSQYQFAVYDNVLKWIGSLKYMIPGEGYMMKCETGGGVITYPRSGLVAARIEAQQPENLRVEGEWKVSPHNFASEMSLLGQIANDSIIGEGDELAAFSNGVCRGVETPVYDKIGKRNLFFLSIFGENGDKNISFKLKKANGKMYDVKESLGFGGNKLEGSFENPFQLSLYKTEVVPTDLLLESVSIQPNPFSNTVNFQFEGLPSSTLTIKITNVLGVELKQIYFNPETASFETFSNLQWDGKDKAGGVVSPGTYVVSITSGDKTVKKLIVKE
ncbi:MAG: LamG-like jellyroll fold domain-containing protein [Cytophagales bacterium]